MLRSSTSLLIVSLALVVSCNFPPIPSPPPSPTPTPIPTPDPTPTPPPNNCLPDLPWCHEVNMYCGECKHNPTQDPNHCEKAPPCPEPTPEPTPDPSPTPPPTTNNCPKQLAPGSFVYLNNKPYPSGNPASNKRDSTVRVSGDTEFCRIIHGVAVNDCHLEGWSKRSECEMELLSGCPVWEYITSQNSNPSLCVNDQETALVSCDHFGDPLNRDDPDTPEFEGKPEACGLQRNEFGPYAGFFTAVHITPGIQTYVRACPPNRNPSQCGPWSQMIETVESVAIHSKGKR